MTRKAIEAEVIAALKAAGWSRGSWAGTWTESGGAYYEGTYSALRLAGHAELAERWMAR